MLTKRESKKHAKSQTPRRVSRRTERGLPTLKKVLFPSATTKDLKREHILETKRLPRSLLEFIRIKILVKTKRKFTKTKREALLPNLWAPSPQGRSRIKLILSKEERRPKCLISSRS